MGQIIAGWVKGGLLIAIVPWVFVGMIGLGVGLRALGVKVEDDEKKSDA